MLSWLLAVAIAPYQSVTLPDGSNQSIIVDCGDPNVGIVEGAWSFGSPGSGWNRWLGAKWDGWNGETQLDPTAQGVWFQPLSGQTWGAVDSQNRVWPDEDGAIRIYTNRSTLRVTVYGSPCESVRLVGNDNALTVYAYSGVQSIYKLPRPGVHVKGDRNRIGGYIEHPICGLYVVGNETTVQDLTVVGCAIGADVAGVWFQGGEKIGGTKVLGYYNGATVRNVTVRQSGREYPYDWHVSGVRFDDGFSRATIQNLTVIGDFSERWFNYLGSDIRELRGKKKQ